MTPEQNKAIVRRFVEEGINNVNLAVFDELVAAEVDFDAPPGLPRSREGWKQNRLLLQGGFPDAHWQEECLIAEGDVVVWRGVMRATHTGEFLGIPATGKTIAITATSVLKVSGGRIIWQRMNSDDLGLMTQIGVVSLPTPN
ncbi:MAG: ester cyclase [Anaerolineaceae bacterium]|nr:ester cyclase [Anaerolineaceae bacterium]MCB9140618.1 ester cyclase [Caldilineaceae bacterium]